jgi:hypothetical protein
MEVPIIGTPARFAVEYSLDQEHGGVWLFGKVRFWIGCESVGDFDLGTSLRDFLFQIEAGRRNRGRRTNGRFDSMPAHLVIDNLNAALFVPGNAELEEISVVEEWARHQLNPGIDVFDDWRIYLVENAVTARLLWQHKTNSAKEIILAPGECDTVLEDACREIGALYDSELKEDF